MQAENVRRGREAGRVVMAEGDMWELVRVFGVWMDGCVCVCMYLVCGRWH